MSKRIGAALCLLSLLSACSFSSERDIATITSIKQASHVFTAATTDDLFIFDADLTIFEPTDPTLQARHLDAINSPENAAAKKIMDDFYASKNNKNNQELAHKKLVTRLDMIQPVEQALIQDIVDLKKRSIKVIVLTRFSTGAFGDVKRAEELRYQQLLKLGLDFSKSFEPQDLTLSELHETDDATRHPTFYKGILFGTDVPKGIVLATFLKKTGCKPAHIYFFDDGEKQCKSVVEEMKKIGIPCQAFVYRAAFTHQEALKLNAEILRLQFKLIKEGPNYVSYPEAEAIFNAQQQHGSAPA